MNFDILNAATTQAKKPAQAIGSFGLTQSVENLFAAQERLDASINRSNKLGETVTAMRRLRHIGATEGLTKSLMKFVDPNSQLASGTPSLALEKFGATPSKNNSNRAAVEALGEKLKKAKDTVVKFLVDLYNRVKKFFVDLFDALLRKEKAFKAVEKTLEGKTVDAKAFGEKKAGVVSHNAAVKLAGVVAAAAKVSGKLTTATAAELKAILDGACSDVNVNDGKLTKGAIQKELGDTKSDTLSAKGYNGAKAQEYVKTGLAVIEDMRAVRGAEKACDAAVKAAKAASGSDAADAQKKLEAARASATNASAFASATMSVSMKVLSSLLTVANAAAGAGRQTSSVKS